MRVGVSMSVDTMDTIYVVRLLSDVYILQTGIFVSVHLPKLAIHGVTLTRRPLGSTEPLPSAQFIVWRRNFLGDWNLVLVQLF